MSTTNIRVKRLQEHVVLTRSYHAKNGNGRGPKPKRYNGAWQDICQLAAQIVRDREVPSSLRYVFYRLVTQHVLLNSLSDYTALATNTAKARREGTFPRMVDHNREIYRPGCYESLSDQLKSECSRMIDRDVGQPYGIFVAVEKMTVAESVKHWLRPYCIPTIILRGYASQTLIDEVTDDAMEEAEAEVSEMAADVLGMARTDERPLVLLTIGDFDASGDHLMRLFVERTDCWETVIQVGVTSEQATTLEQAPAKAKDTRLEGFVRRYWPERYAELQRDMRDRTQEEKIQKYADTACQVEVEALEANATLEDPEPLRTLLMEALAPFWDDDVAEEQKVKERRMQSILRRLADRSEDDIESWLDAS